MYRICPDRNNLVLDVGLITKEINCFSSESFATLGVKYINDPDNCTTYLISSYGIPNTMNTTATKLFYFYEFRDFRGRYYRHAIT